VVLEAGDALLHRVPEHARAADVTWRQSQLAIAHGWTDRAVADLDRMAKQHATDRRAPLAATERGEVLFRANRYDEAGAAFEAALAASQAQHADSLVRIAQRALPVCAYRAADAAVAADSNAYAHHAARFEQVAARWPAYELSPLAQYRAGLAYGRAHQPREAVRAMQALLQAYPRCPYAGDARLQVARTFEEMHDLEPAAQAYLEFSRGETDRENAAAAWLKAAELLAAAGRQGAADSLRLDYIRRWPGDVEGAMAIMEALARRDLAAVDAQHPVSRLLGPPARARAAAQAQPVSHLADYLRRAAAHPKLASRDVIAQVRFLQGEEANTPFAALRLTQPLARSVPAKKAMLDTVLVRYRRSADLGVPAWAHASAFRIGQALQGFAEALENSEPPADLSGDDLRAYRNVLAEKASAFSARGDEVWSQLLRQQDPDSTGDAWVAQARAALYGRLAHRFLFRPEVTFPLVEAGGPSRVPEADTNAGAPADSAAPSTRTARALARREGAPR
jgi:predicted negative regulator of RcsB-dependent stress response